MSLKVSRYIQSLKGVDGGPFVIRNLFGFVIAASLPMSAASAQENWWYAESDHFRVYSAGGQDAAQDMAVKLERVDQAMRLYTGVAAENAPLPDVAKPTIFQFGETKDIGRLIGQENVAGFFIPRAGNSVAFVPLEQGRETKRYSGPGTRDTFDFYDYDIAPDKVLFHEYAHYFMFQHSPAAYPAWYIEGLAELFGQLKLEDDGFALGEVPPHRQGEIAGVNIDLDEIFQRDDRNARSLSYPYYGHGWLLTSYLSFHPERQGQLAQFLRSINAGTPTREAAETAFGDLGNLERELRNYRRERARVMAAKFPVLAAPAVDLRALSAAEAAQMDVMIQSQTGVSRSQAKKVVEDARSLLTKFPDSPSVKRALLEAEFDNMNFQRADELAVALSDTDFALDAHLYRARIAMEYAKKDQSWLATARSHFLAANQIEAKEPNALAGYYLTYRLAGETPPEDALIALEEAYRIAPFDQNIREWLAHLLLLENRQDDALRVLAPIINRPHGGKESKKLRELVNGLEAGEKAALIEELAPSLEEEEA